MDPQLFAKTFTNFTHQYLEAPGRITVGRTGGEETPDGRRTLVGLAVGAALQGPTLKILAAYAPNSIPDDPNFRVVDRVKPFAMPPGIYVPARPDFAAIYEARFDEFELDIRLGSDDQITLQGVPVAVLLDQRLSRGPVATPE